MQIPLWDRGWVVQGKLSRGQVVRHSSEQKSSQAIEIDWTFIASTVNGQTFIQGTLNMEDIYSFKLQHPFERKMTYSTKDFRSLNLAMKVLKKLEFSMTKIKVIRLLGKESWIVTKEEKINTAGDANNKDLQEKLQELEFHHSIFKQEDNLLCDKNKSLLRAIWLINNEFQNPNEEKCSSTTINCNYLSTRVTKTCSAGKSKIQSVDNQTSKLTHPLWNVLAPLHKHWKGTKVKQQCIQAFVVWSFKNQNEWNSCFSSGCLLNSPQKNTHSPFIIWPVQALWFLSRYVQDWMLMRFKFFMISITKCPHR